MGIRDSQVARIRQRWVSGILMWLLLLPCSAALGRPGSLAVTRIRCRYDLTLVQVWDRPSPLRSRPEALESHTFASVRFRCHPAVGRKASQSHTCAGVGCDRFGHLESSCLGRNPSAAADRRLRLRRGRGHAELVLVIGIWRFEFASSAVRRIVLRVSDLAVADGSDGGPLSTTCRRLSLQS